jgi:hypothetical protein
MSTAENLRTSLIRSDPKINNIILFKLKRNLRLLREISCNRKYDVVGKKDTNQGNIVEQFH